MARQPLEASVPVDGDEVIRAVSLFHIRADELRAGVQELPQPGYAARPAGTGREAEPHAARGQGLEVADPDGGGGGRVDVAAAVLRRAVRLVEREYVRDGEPGVEPRLDRFAERGVVDGAPEHRHELEVLILRRVGESRRRLPLVVVVPRQLGARPRPRRVVLGPPRVRDEDEAALR